MSDLAPSTLLVEGFLGIGTYGRVYIARPWDQKDRLVAMKVIKKDLIVARGEVDDVNREARLLLNLEHPFVIRGLSMFQDADKLYLITELITGHELWELVYGYPRKRKGLTQRCAKFCTTEIICALIYLERHNIIHRDLKLENILIDADGHVKIVDFGFACEGPIGEGLAGTPLYLSPEVVLRQPHTRAVDCWALGVCIFEMILGECPFVSVDGDIEVLYNDIVFKDIVWPTRMPKVVKDLVRRLLEPNAEMRLGAPEMGGIAGIAGHEWFKGLRWDKVVNKEIRSPFALAQPIVRDVTDDDMSFLYDNEDAEDLYCGTFASFTYDCDDEDW